MSRRYGKKRPKIVELSAENELTCGCDARDEYSGHRGWYPREVMPFGDDEPGKDIRGRRVMLLYTDGTMRHKRCGRISGPAK